MTAVEINSEILCDVLEIIENKEGIVLDFIGIESSGYSDLEEEEEERENVSQQGYKICPALHPSFHMSGRQIEH